MRRSLASVCALRHFVSLPDFSNSVQHVHAVSSVAAVVSTMFTLCHLLQRPLTCVCDLSTGPVFRNTKFT